jgi:hypothetical protein
MRMVRNKIGCIILLVIFGLLCMASIAQPIETESNQMMAVPICGHINASEVLSVKSAIESGSSSASFVLSWTNVTTDLQMVLETPRGQEINQSVKPPAIYGKNESLIYYIIPDPEAGNWTAEIFADNMPASGEDYCLDTLLSPGDEFVPENSADGIGIGMLNASENSGKCEGCSQED